MDYPELALFSENLAKLLEAGVLFAHASAEAREGVKDSGNRQITGAMRDGLLSGQDLGTVLAGQALPCFYVRILQCGHQTGRLAEALRAGAYFLRQVEPVRCRVRRCWRLAVGGLLVGMGFRWLLGGGVSVWIVVLGVLLVLPGFCSAFRYAARDWLLARLPFVGLASQELALMEFFKCLEIAYDTTLDVREMFRYSSSAIDNRYLRGRMKRAEERIGQGLSFTAALRAVGFVPRGLLVVIDNAEISGTLDSCFSAAAAQLKTIVEAKLEVFKFFSAAVAIDNVLLIPLFLIVPLVLPEPAVLPAELIIGYMTGFVPYACARGAWRGYKEKTRQMRLWYGS